ncbi:hypothetical protein F5Y10DRAFT_267761 [Nemania abortiva]|nr:hypothetical protein F5Y10DRAFT_267761 [Nemania abortiva]
MCSFSRDCRSLFQEKIAFGSQPVSSTAIRILLSASPAPSSKALTTLVTTNYTIKRLQTIYFTEHPADEEVEARVVDGKVKAAINAGILHKKPDAEVIGKVQVTEITGLGEDAEHSREKTAAHKHQTEEDIIYAYQFQTDESINVYKAPMAASFLHQDKKEEESFECGWLGWGSIVPQGGVRFTFSVPTPSPTAARVISSDSSFLTFKRLLRRPHSPFRRGTRITLTNTKDGTLFMLKSLRSLLLGWAASLAAT